MTGRVYRADDGMSATPGTIRLGTRRSRLAVAQSTQVAEAMAHATGADVALVTVTTAGDLSRAPLSQLGGTGVFVSALRDALLGHGCDVAVHSFKDLPTGPCAGISVGAVPLRADPRDAWCARGRVTPSEVTAGSRVGTGSPRRAAQILALRPDLEVTDIRGNVETRLARIDADLDAVILAAAGLDRVGRSNAITERLSLDAAPPAPGQGALALEVRAADLEDTLISKALQAVDHVDTRLAATAERALLAELEAGCAAPVGATARIVDGRIALRAAVYQADGQAQLDSRVDASVAGVTPMHTAAELGRRAARELLERGAAELADLHPEATQS